MQAVRGSGTDVKILHTRCSGGTKRKLTNWKKGHSFQLAIMAAFQSCFSLGTTSFGLPCEQLWRT